MEEQDVLTVVLSGSVGFPLHCVKHRLIDGFSSLSGTSKPSDLIVSLTLVDAGKCFVYYLQTVESIVLH